MVDDNWSRWKFLLKVVILAQILFLLFPKLDLHISVSVLFLVIPRVHSSSWENLSTLPYSYTLHSRQPGECAQMSLVLFTNSIFFSCIVVIHRVDVVFNIFSRQEKFDVCMVIMIPYVFQSGYWKSVSTEKIIYPVFLNSLRFIQVIINETTIDFLYVLYVMCVYRLYTT